ncbi:hemicentin-1-like isoform X2 [Oscarella lobularis]|uniref:hemicentin-1-like isoform X2 n=1 Tax=Oscarella lobularis TaxID=121494 RepID=UPI003313C7B7
MKRLFLVLVYGAYFLIPSAQFDLERCGSSVSVGTKRIVYYQIVNESVSLSSAPDYANDPIEPIIRWYRDGRLIAANKRLITFVAESGLNGSVYRFTVSEFRGDVIFESDDVVLIVGEIPRLELLSGRRLSFRETSNDTLKIRLDVSGVPRPRLRVVRPQNRSRVFSLAKFEIRSNAIHVRGLSLEDWGDYEVIASSCLGNVMINMSIKILGGVDQTNLTDTTKEILCSKNVEFTCTAVAYPKPSIEWVWNGTLLFDGRYGITEESVMAPDGHRRKITSTLKITGVEREDNERGLIRCKSNNGIEETSIGFRLNVLCTPSACSVRFVQSELTNDSVVANIEHPTDNGGFSVNHLRVLVYALVEEQSSLISNNTYGHDQEFIKPTTHWGTAR